MCCTARVHRVLQRPGAPLAAADTPRGTQSTGPRGRWACPPASSCPLPAPSHAAPKSHPPPPRPPSPTHPLLPPPTTTTPNTPKPPNPPNSPHLQRVLEVADVEHRQLQLDVPKVPRAVRELQLARLAHSHLVADALRGRGQACTSVGVDRSRGGRATSLRACRPGRTAAGRKGPYCGCGWLCADDVQAPVRPAAPPPRGPSRSPGAGRARRRRAAHVQASGRAGMQGRGEPGVSAATLVALAAGRLRPRAFAALPRCQPPTLPPPPRPAAH